MTNQPMVKMMILAPRNAAMSHEQFRDYVTNVHGPLVKSIPEVARGIRRYHYNFPVPGAVDPLFGHPLASQFDIVTQAWFDSLAAHRENQSHARYWSVIRPDEEVMADNANARFHYMREREILSGDIGERKLFVMRRRRPDLSRDEFQQAWHSRIADAMERSPAAHGGIARYVQNHTLPEADHPEGAEPKYFDVIDEFVLGRGGEGLLDRDPALKVEIARIEVDLTDTSRTLAFVGETVRNIDGPVR